MYVWMIRRILIAIGMARLLLTSYEARAQIKIGGDPNRIEASSILELEAKDRGILIPRMNGLERDSISQAPTFNDSISHGLLIYNTDQNCLNFYDSAGAGGWTNLCRVYIPITDTSKANRNDPHTGDIIVDSDCDCILIRDTSNQWKPLTPAHGGWNEYQFGSTTTYLLETAAVKGDTLVFTEDHLLGIGTARPRYSLDLVSHDSLFLRTSMGQIDVLTASQGIIGNDTVTLLSSPNQSLVWQVDVPDSNTYIGLNLDGSIDFSRYGRGEYRTTKPAYVLGVDSAGNLVEFTGFMSVSSSDERLKRNISSLEDQARKLYSLTGVSYYWRDDQHSVKRFDTTLAFGVIAQEVERLYPNLVTTDNQGYKMVNYQGLIPLLLENQKRQQRENDELRARLQRLERRLEMLEDDAKAKQ